MLSQNPSKLQKYKGLTIALFLVLLISAPFVWHFRHTIKKTIKNNFSHYFKSKNNVCACTWDTLKLNKDNYKKYNKNKKFFIHCIQAIIGSNPNEAVFT